MLKKIFKRLVLIFLIIVVIVISIIIYVRTTTADQIKKNTEDINGDLFSTALILGASVYGGKPSPMLKDRLDAGIELYKQGKVNHLLMSGDGRDIYYNEVEVMEKYAISKNVPQRAIIKDGEGLNTYASINRLRKVYGIKNVVIVSQEFHLNRAVYIANKLGVASVGYPAEDKMYNDLPFLYFRDWMASVKDFFGLLI